MPSDVSVKVCGLTSAAAMEDAAKAGARYAGLVFFEKSPRNVSIDQAREIALAAPIGLAKVALTVDASDDFLQAMLDKVAIDIIQLHGKETPERVREVKAKFGLPVMKAVGVADKDDLFKLDMFSEVADQILVDAKAPKGADLPGGNGLAFDWTLIQGRRWSTPWMLAGGLTPETARKAVEMTGARQLDVSSGVESAPGIKDAQKMQAFVQAAQG